MKARLETASNGLMILTCITVLGLLAYRGLWPPAGALPRYDRGERLDMSLPGVTPGRRVVVVKVRSTCEFCTLSMPRFRELLAMSSVPGSGFTVVVAGDETRATLDDYLRQNDLMTNNLVDLRGVHAKLAACPVPYVVIIDGTSRVVDSWPGLITPSRLEQIRSALNAPN